MIFHTAEQGSEEWLEARRGVITASRFRHCREKLKSGAMSQVALAYAQDVARERVGGLAPQKFQNAAMRQGTEQEPVARAEYEAQTGAIVSEVGFACTPDKKFGVSVDGLIGLDGAWECKTLVSSDTLFNVLVAGDIADYKDQCNGAMWLLGLKWVDLSLWVPDLQKLKTIRIARDDDAIERLEADLLAFESLVTNYADELCKSLDLHIETLEIK